MATFKHIDIDGTSYDLPDVSKTQKGLCPQLPNESTTAKYLRQDGTWVVPPDTTYNVVNKTANGLCPQLPNENTTTKYLRQDGTWVVPPNTTYGVVTTSANGLCPTLAGGTTKYLRADGTWAVPPDTTYSVVSKTANGLCPQLPNETTTTKYLRQDGTWVVPPNTTYSVVSKTANGLCPQLPNETTTTKYLRQDGTWVVPPNTTTGTTYTPANIPDNTTFGTNGSIKGVYDLVKNNGKHYGTQTSENVSSAGWHAFTNKLNIDVPGWYVVICTCNGNEVAITGIDYTQVEGYASGNIYVKFVRVDSTKQITGYGYFTQALNNAYNRLEAIRIASV